MNDLFLDIMRTQSVSYKTEAMQKCITKHLSRLHAAFSVSATGNIYAVKGVAEVYPTIVAHTDTVHAIIPQDCYTIHNSGDIWFAFNNKRGEMTGIGGDDKVGIYIALTLMERLPAMKAAFFVDEEVGCRGAAVADMSWFADSAFVLQADRRGYGDFVHRAGGVELHGKEFEKATAPHLERFAIKPTFGAMTDVMELKDNGLDVAAANISCGYHNPHTSKEVISALDVEYTLEFMYELCINLGHRRWLHTAPKTLKTRSYRNITTAVGASTNPFAATHCSACGAKDDVLVWDQFWRGSVCLDCRRRVSRWAYEDEDEWENADRFEYFGPDSETIEWRSPYDNPGDDVLWSSSLQRYMRRRGDELDMWNAVTREWEPIEASDFESPNTVVEAQKTVKALPQQTS